MTPPHSVGSWHGGQVGAYAHAVLAPNPGPLTLDGTNTWVLRAPGSVDSVVIDPGPADAQHLQQVWRQATEAGAHVARVLLTHGHSDHSAGANVLAARAGVPVEAQASGQLHDGQAIQVQGLTVRCVSAPGHTSDSVCFHIPQAAALITGDTILGRGSSLIAHPEGNLGQYLATLERLRALATKTSLALLPGHARPHPDAAPVIDALHHHRVQRLAQVRSAAEHLGPDADAIVQACYPGVTGRLRQAARASVLAQLDYLAGQSA